MKRLVMVVMIMAVGLLLTAPAVGNIVSGFHYYGGYGSHNHLYQWEIGTETDGSDTRPLGKVDLAATFGYNPQMSGSNTAYADLAMLSDRRVALTHRDADSNRVISILTPQYDVDGLLTGVNVDATLTPALAHTAIAPLPNGGFVTVGGGTAVIYTQTGANTWSSANVSLSNGTSYDIAGLINPGEDQFAVGHYDRQAYRYNSSGLQANYDGDTKAPWGDGSRGEGLRSDLLSGNAFMVSGAGDYGANRPAAILDGTESDGGTYTGVVGKILNGDGSEIIGGEFAALDNGRIVRVIAWGWSQTGVTWNVYSLVEDPALQPAGSIGATGEDIQVFTAGNLVGRIAGDYMYQAAAPVPEPATLALIALGGMGLLAGGARRRQ